MKIERRKVLVLQNRKAIKTKKMMMNLKESPKDLAATKVSLKNQTDKTLALKKAKKRKRSGLHPENIKLRERVIFTTNIRMGIF